MGWFQPEVKVEHHGFCDASQKAYGAAIYLRVEVGHNIMTHLLTAKTRVVPVKTVSLPRLELCGALLLSEMIAAILPNMPISNSDIFCWTDSTIVLAWLNKPAFQWATFVANRVTKIIQVTSAEHWAHVRSEHNSADLASRGVSLQDLVHSQLWWKGPDWLQQPKGQWPTQGLATPVTDLEQRAVKVNFAKALSDDFLERFSKLDKALRVLAYVLRFTQRCRKMPRGPADRPTKEEVREAERALILYAQREEYTQELKFLNDKCPIPVSSPIANLFPFLDQHVLLRACGRITASTALQYDERHPIILPYNCRLSRLLVLFSHQISLHGGNQLVVRLIRSKYWIPKPKNLVKAVLNSCKALHQQFSARWKEEYLKELHKRNKWQNPSKDIHADDMVVVKEDNMPSNDWRLGRVVSVFPGADSRVRVVEIRTARGIIKRPVHKLVLLPMEAKAASVLPK
ncbi:uncharacterized protein LOC128263878 [Drosophila gunungcola]|uniref:uncharacterized protein LOC128263878 n=1 Tax=Drosophila gunungcola TaxID=103775 RepID=UPI0022E02DAC|nr:uncharacterized protein LOC128263878 [Drosophila gunungcola]